MPVPKGVLLPIGGNEDKGENEEKDPTRESYESFLEHGVLKRMLLELKEENPRIEVITAATAHPRKVGQNYLKAFELLGCSNVGVMNMDAKQDTDQPSHLKRLKEAHAVIFSGGAQTDIVNYLDQTEFLDILRYRYMEEHFLIAGTSAGAMAMTEIMIERSDAAADLLKTEVSLTKGLHMLNNVIIDTHFVTRGRFWRLATAVAQNPDCLGIGLCEDTGVIIKEGKKLEVVGSGLCFVIDGRNVSRFIVIGKEDASSLTIENVVNHIMSRGNTFDLETCRVGKISSVREYNKVDK